jgi:DNA-directed RNA polymerase specialized sigma24 family protein
MAKAWTPDEDTLLLKLREEGFTSREMSVRLNRTDAAIRKRLSLIAEKKHIKWTDADKEKVLAYKAEGLTNRRIAYLMGRTTSSVTSLLSRLKSF